MIPTLLPVTEEVDGVQRFIYRAVFPITFSIREQYRTLDILFSDYAMRGREVKALLNTFGFLSTMKIGTDQTPTGHLIFRQKLLIVDTACGDVVQYSESIPGEDTNMCCRYFIDDKADELLPYFESAVHSSLTDKLVAKLGKPLVTTGEVRPTNMTAGIALNKRGIVSTFPMVWGYSVQGGRGPVFNARSETAAEKPLFKEGWKNHRCIIPASYFFEWGYPADEAENGTAGRQKTKFAIQPKGACSTWLAGIYRLEESNGVQFPAFTILTKEATGQMSSIHERMPVMLRQDQISDWLSPDIDPEGIVRRSIRDLVIEKAAG